MTDPAARHRDRAREIAREFHEWAGLAVRIADALAADAAETLERAAQIAERWGAGAGTRIAASIRLLKEGADAARTEPLMVSRETLAVALHHAHEKEHEHQMERDYREQDPPEPWSNLAMNDQARWRCVADEAMALLLRTGPSISEAARTESGRGRAFRSAVEGVVAYAQSGWRPERGEFYCLVCDESLRLTPGRTNGKRGATWAEIHHDAECPVPDLIALLASSEPSSATPPPYSNVQLVTTKAWSALTAAVASLRAENERLEKCVAMLLLERASLRSVLTPLKALAEKATPSPWFVEDDGGAAIEAAFEDVPRAQLASMGHTHWSQPDAGRTVRLGDQTRANHQLIVALRNALPTLLATLEPTP